MAVGLQSVGGFNFLAKLNTAKGKLVRKFGENIFGNPKYDRLLNRKPYSPGQHGQSRRGKLSNYGVQLQEKQKIKFMYGLLEKQFRLNFEKAEKVTGETGTNMLQLLESRLDNVVYRLGIAPTRRAARQFVSHRHITVNGNLVNIPSYALSAGDVIGVRERSKSMEAINNSISNNSNQMEWLEFNFEKRSGKVSAIPERIQIPEKIKEQLIVELYSK